MNAISISNVSEILRAMRSYGKFHRRDSVDELARRAALVRSMVAVAARMGPVSEARAKETADKLVADLRTAIRAKFAAQGVTL